MFVYNKQTYLTATVKDEPLRGKQEVSLVPDTWRRKVLQISGPLVESEHFKSVLAILFDPSSRPETRRTADDGRRGDGSG